MALTFTFCPRINPPRIIINLHIEMHLDWTIQSGPENPNFVEDNWASFEDIVRLRNEEISREEEVGKWPPQADQVIKGVTAHKYHII